MSLFTIIYGWRYFITYNFCVLTQPYKHTYNKFLYVQDPTATVSYGGAIDLSGASAVVAIDYVKRPHVFRLKLANGGDYIFQCKDDVRLKL